MTKVTIISGFLGAGKTTFIKKLLEEVYKGQKVVLIENEFGEIGIDGGFLKDAGVQINEMNSGCICCSLVGDFGRALKQVAADYKPDMIIIEPSGVGKLSDVIAAVENVAEEAELTLENFITVADGTKCKMYIKNFGEFYNNQIESASTIVLSRTQNMTEDKLEAAVALIREHNDKAAIITTPWDDLTGKQIEDAMKKTSLVDEMLKEMDVCPVCGHHHDDEDEHEHHHDHDGECCCGHDHEHEHHHDHEHDHHHHHADDVFTSWGTETPKKYEKAELDSILKKLSESEDYGKVLRSKGMLPCTDGTWMYFDLVPEEYEIREGSADFTGRICVIGSELKEDALKELFEV